MSTAPTQTVHPWRATLRTGLAVLLALASAAPLIIIAIEGDNPGSLGWLGVQVLAVSGAITRLMAVPAVNDLLARIGLGTSPRAELTGRHAEDRGTLGP